MTNTAVLHSLFIHFKLPFNNTNISFPYYASFCSFCSFPSYSYFVFDDSNFSYLNILCM